MWDGCASSLAASSSALGETWVQGVGTTAEGAVAAQYVSGNVNRLSGLSPAQKQAALATLAAYDTYLKSGGGRRARHLQMLGGSLLGGISPLLQTYTTLRPYAVSPDCTSLFRELAMQRFANGNGPLTGTNGGGSPGGLNSPGGMPPSNPFPSSPMSAQEPPNPFDGATSTVGQDSAEEGSAGTGTTPQATAAPPQVGDQGTNRCKTFSSGEVGVQLCQGTTTTEASATITGSVINVGQETLCGLKLIVDSFELSSSYYPNWLPNYEGLFMPGDTITFGVTVPYAQGAPKPQADVDSGIAVCAPPTPSPTPASTNATLAPSIAANANANANAGGAGAPAGRPGVDWASIGGGDTSCLQGCQNLVEGLTACEGFDAIGNFRCDLCSAAQYAEIQQVCLGEYKCGEKMCHIAPAIKSQSSGAGRRAGAGDGSVKASFSLLLGFLTVALLLTMG
jgi:hypothetical protein